MTATILEMRQITKTFPGVKALENVNLKVKEGEIHALMGENGAGKSTLMKVLSGVYPHGTYEGDILFKDEVCEFKGIKQSEGKGIVIIHQELALIPQLSISENIFLGNEQATKGIINWNQTVQRTRELLKIVGLSESPNTIVSEIGVGKQQLVEIAKALSKEVKLLILDEPTAALNEDDSENLLNLLLEFKKQGITSVIISHKLNEIMKVADSITILRDGKSIETLDIKKDNITEGSKYWELTKLAAKCTAKRMVPDYISEKKMLELKVDKKGEGHCYTCMGCRSFLTPYIDPETGKSKYYGRFNQGVVTLNLVDVACSSEGNEEKFWQIMDERLDICYRALMCRHKRLLGTPSDVAPILWQNGALARLKKGEKIDKLLFNGYSTISLGYAGLCECVRYMKGVSHTDAAVGTPFALKVMKKLNEACATWKAQEHMDFSLYGTPLESTTYKFAKCLQKRFGIIEGVTDRNYITNSYHVHVTEEMNAFDKLKFEAQFQELSPGGAISYVEVPNMQNNIEAVLSVMQYIYDNIMYAELNTKSDYCQCCGYDGEIQIVEEEGSGKLIWECPNCGNRNQDKMSVARRTCGYIGTQYWNQGRTQEIKERVLHL